MARFRRGLDTCSSPYRHTRGPGSHTLAGGRWWGGEAQGRYGEPPGRGEPLLLIQGMSGPHLTWGEPFLSRLEADFDCVVFDNRGIGNSAEGGEPFTIADLAADTVAVMDAAGLEAAHVLGISMGGMIAQEVAL